MTSEEYIGLTWVIIMLAVILLNWRRMSVLPSPGKMRTDQMVVMLIMVLTTAMAITVLFAVTQMVTSAIAAVLAWLVSLYTAWATWKSRFPA